MPESHHAELKVKDFDRLGGARGPSGSDVVWHWIDESRQLTLSPAEHEALQSLMDEADDQYELDECDHNTTLAKIWITNDREVDNVEWC